MPAAHALAGKLGQLWWRNWRIGAPERARGLHYWLGYEYALVFSVTRTRPGEVWVDVGAGAHSTLAYLFAERRGVRVVGVDVTERLPEQQARNRRAVRAGVVTPGQVAWARGDARRLPLASREADGVLGAGCFGVGAPYSQPG